MPSKTKVVTDRFTTLLTCMVLPAAALLNLAVPRAYAATNLLNRSDKISDPRPSATANHLIGFTYTDFATPVGSVLIEFCSNSPIAGDSCTAPAGFDLTGSILLNEFGETGFSKHANSNANRFILTRSAVLPTTGSSTYELSSVINPSVEGTYFVRLQTFTATDATGTAIQEGGIAVSAVGEIVVSTEVPPHLTFCVSVTIVNYDCSSATSFFIDLGELSKTSTKSASSQMVATTNAEFGYTIFVNGTTFTSGNNTIPALTVPTPSAIGISQFGINLRANTLPSIGAEPQGPGTAGVTAGYNIPNQYKYQNGEGVASGGNSQDYRKYTVSYIVNINNAQAPGVYASTFTFICLANF